MNDLFEHADNPGKPAPPPSFVKPVRRFAGMSPRELMMLVAAIAIFIWGAWVTKNLVTEDASEPEFVQLQLQSIISEYLTAQARSSADEQTAAQQTGMFMTTLDHTVAGLSESGKVILVHEAVIGRGHSRCDRKREGGCLRKGPAPADRASAGRGSTI